MPIPIRKSRPSLGRAKQPWKITSPEGDSLWFTDKGQYLGWTSADDNNLDDIMRQIAAKRPEGK
jgi:hypothetical protein